MSDQIHWLLRLEIKPGQFNAFNAVMNNMVSATRKEEGTLIYEWYFNADKTVCEIHERYRDSAAVLIHSASFSNFAESFLAAAIPTWMGVYGNPSDEVKQGLAAFTPQYFTLKEGFDRF